MRNKADKWTNWQYDQHANRTVLPTSLGLNGGFSCFCSSFCQSMLSKNWWRRISPWGLFGMPRRVAGFLSNSCTHHTHTHTQSDTVRHSVTDSDWLFSLSHSVQQTSMIRFLSFVTVGVLVCWFVGSRELPIRQKAAGGFNEIFPLVRRSSPAAVQTPVRHDHYDVLVKRHVRQTVIACSPLTGHAARGLERLQSLLAAWPVLQCPAPAIWCEGYEMSTWVRQVIDSGLRKRG